MVDITKTLNKALRGLEADRARVDSQIAAVEQALRAVDGRQSRNIGRATPAPRRRRSMSAAARKAMSRRMKAYWATRRRAEAKGSTVKK